MIRNHDCKPVQCWFLFESKERVAVEVALTRAQVAVARVALAAAALVGAGRVAALRVRVAAVRLARALVYLHVSIEAKLY